MNSHVLPRTPGCMRGPVPLLSRKVKQPEGVRGRWWTRKALLTVATDNGRCGLRLLAAPHPAVSTTNAPRATTQTKARPAGIVPILLAVRALAWASLRIALD